MAEYLVQDTSLTAVADAIRAKTGSADLLAFPSGMVDAISGIASGGGGVNVQSGSFTPAEALSSYTVSVEGVVKNFFVAIDSMKPVSGVRNFLMGAIFENGNILTETSNAGGTSSGGVHANNSVTIRENAVDISRSGSYLVPTKYFWYAW